MDNNIIYGENLLHKNMKFRLCHILHCFHIPFNKVKVKFHIHIFGLVKLLLPFDVTYSAIWDSMSYIIRCNLDTIRWT